MDWRHCRNRHIERWLGGALNPFVQAYYWLQVEELIVYTRPEDEFYHKHCTASYTFPTSRAAGKDELLALRLVMLLSSEQISAARCSPFCPHYVSTQLLEDVY